MTVYLTGAALCLVVLAWVTRPFWSARTSAVLLALLLTLLAGGGYFVQGSWQAQQHLTQAAANPERAQAQMIQGMVDRLAARLQQNPDDAEGWKKLGRSYAVLGRYQESATAYAKSNALTRDGDVEALLGEAESLAQTSERQLAGKPAQLIAKALKQAPDDPRALWFSGLAAAQTEDYTSAARHWRRLLQQPIPEEIRADLQRRVEEIENLSRNISETAP